MKKIKIYNKYDIFVDESDLRFPRLNKLNTEPDDVKSLRKYIEKTDLYIDVGANYGEFIVPYMEYNIPIIAFEPNKTVFNCLSETCKSYNNIHLFNVALNSSTTRLVFHVDQSSGKSSLLKGVIFNTKESYEVDCFKLDELLSPEQYIDKDLVCKIDVEGTEDDIIEGMLDIIQGCNSIKILFEFNNNCLDRAKKDKRKFLKKIFNLFPGTLPKIEAVLNSKYIKQNVFIERNN